jgi:MarR family 2-MHQ and catechol resistance regulon transcriptional repressor
MMNQITTKNASKQDFIPLMRELVRAYQAFASFDAELHRLSGSKLTVSQADVIFTLGNTDGMNCSELGNLTLITKGTLTGVIDRLVKKGLVTRSRKSCDARFINIELTSAGHAMFAKHFPRQIAEIKSRFDRIDSSTQHRAIEILREIRSAF